MSAQPAIAPTRPGTGPSEVRPWTPVILDGGAPARRPGSADAGRAGAVRVGGPRGPHGPDVTRLAPPTRAAAWRRRAAVAAVPAALALALAGLFGGGTADAELADPVAGTVTVAPGETLWDVAAATAPDGVDTRDQVARLVELNGLDGARIDPWTVVLLPAG